MAQVKERGGVGKKGISPLVPFLARPKPKIRFLGLSLLRNQTETLATQANKYNTVLLYLFIYLFIYFSFLGLTSCLIFLSLINFMLCFRAVSSLETLVCAEL